MSVLSFVTLVVIGFVACVEFGSYAFVHPVLRLLPRREWLTVEQGLLHTFGRVMPAGMTLALILLIVVAVPAGRVLPWAAATAVGLAVVSTIVINVPINAATGRWDVENPPPGWEATRRRWEIGQAVRSWLLLIGFVLTCAAVTQ